MHRIDIYSEANEILLNPRWPDGDKKQLQALAEMALQHFNLKAHVVLATSGSTSSSVVNTKLVLISKKALLNSAQGVNHFFGLDQSMTWGQVLPQFHVGGLGVFLRAGLCGSKVVEMCDDSQHWNPEVFYEKLINEKISLASMVPTQLFDLLHKKKKSPESLKYVFIGGGKLPYVLLEQAHRLGWPLVLTYGMTESSSMVAASEVLVQSTELDKMFEMRSMSHASVVVNNEGLISVKANSLLTAYAFIDPQGEFKVIDPKVDGHFLTEDHGESLPEGKIKILGREGDFMKIGGESTSLSRLNGILEGILNQHYQKYFKDFVVQFHDDPRLGHIVMAYTSLPSDVANDIQLEFNDSVLPFERIRLVKYVSEIPRSDLGKVLWGKLKSAAVLGG